MKNFSYLLNIVLLGFIGFMAYKFVYDGNVATGTDNRTVVVLTAAEKTEVLGEMRGLLETVQSVIEASTTGNIEDIPAITEPFGMAAVANESINLAAKLPLELKTMGYDAHRAMDTLGAMATEGASGDEILSALGEAMVLCTTCHSSYRFVAEEDLD